MTRSDVLIVGAGPTGLALALGLATLGVTVRILDRSAAPGVTSRALAVQARTLELYGLFGLSEEIVRRGHKTPAVNFWVRGRPAARASFVDIGRGLTAFPFLLIFTQDQHEQLLIEQLRRRGVVVERGVELTGFDDQGDRIIAKLRRADAREEVCEAAYVAGCDGAHSRVRETIGAQFAGGDYRQLFYVADVEADGPAINGELHIDLDEADFLGVFPMAGAGRARLVGTVRDARPDQAQSLRFEDVSSRAIEHLKVRVSRVTWFSTYRVHHRVAATFRRNRAFILGDAAHVHSPAGGQGMNTGIGDAINLAWKLAAVVKAQAPQTLLDSYEAERIVFARRLVATTDRAFSIATADGWLAALLRTRLAAPVLSALARIGLARTYAFRTVSQITLNYRGGPLSAGRAGRVHGGDRLPWAPAADADNFSALTLTRWRVHVYGAANHELGAWCAAHGLALTSFAWRPEHKAAGLARDALYLLRPDSYVALVDRAGSARALEEYFTRRSLRP